MYRAAVDRGVRYFTITEVREEDGHDWIFVASFSDDRDALSQEAFGEDFQQRSGLDSAFLVYDVERWRFFFEQFDRPVTEIVMDALYVPNEEVGGLMPSRPLKEARFIDVHPNHMVLYPGEQVLRWEDTEELEALTAEFLDRIAERRDEEYVVLLVRPRAALISRHMARLVRARKIDLGIELFEGGRAFEYEKRAVFREPASTPSQ